jgi:cell wall-associated NlpC family hydrolase
MGLKIIGKRAVLLILIVFVACETEKKEENPLEEQITAIKKEYAPDKRIALFDVEAIKNTEKYILKGESNLPNAVSALKEKLSVDNIAFIDSIQILPSEELKGKIYGLITISVANLRSNPKHSAELATQATLGTPVKIYKKEGSWSLIQTPDKYLSWVDSGGMVVFSEQELAQWKSAKKVIYTETTGYSYLKPDLDTQVVSDMVAGAVLKLVKEENEFYAIEYPDGRAGYTSKAESARYSNWLSNLNPTSESLMATSKKLMGLPYLWGGTSTKGVDCSGFTKTIYFLNGMVIPRDASQQVHTGKQTDEDKNFENLEVGDLLFFGQTATDSTAEKVVHVGMWIGNQEFIHSSGQVRISSMNKEADNYDEYNLNRYLRSKRILKKEDKDLIDLTQTPVFND